jgi:hypothetical protein
MYGLLISDLPGAGRGCPLIEVFMNGFCGNGFSLLCNFIFWDTFKMFEKGIGRQFGSEKNWSAGNFGK